MVLKKSRGVYLILVLGLLILSATAVVAIDPAKPFASILDGILSFFKLDFLFGGNSGESNLTGFLRLLVGILVLSALVILGQVLGRALDIQLFSGGAFAVIAVVLSIISIIFIPGSVLIAFGSMLGTSVVMAIPIGIILGSIALFVYIRGQWNSLAAGIIVAILLIALIVLTIVFYNNIAGLVSAAQEQLARAVRS